MEDSKYMCDRCREPLCFVRYDEHVMIRPQRFSQCKNYKGANTSGATCKGIGDSEEGAVLAFDYFTVVIQ